MSNRQSQHVTVSNLIPLYLSDDNRELTVMLGGWQTIIRSNAGTPAAIYYAVKDAISAKHIHLTNVFVDWDKDNHRPRLLVETIDQITVINYTEEEKVERIKNTLVSEYDNKQYFSLTNVELMTTHPTYGGIITWSYNPAEAVIDGKWRAINEQNTLVTATANITVGSATGTQDVSITIIYRDEEQLIYQTGFETAEGFGFLGGNEPYNHQDIYYSGPDNDWGTVNGTPSPDDRIAGFQSMQMRWYNNGYEIYTRTFFNLSKITKVTFKAKNTNNVNVTVYISRDGGTTWENPQTFILGQTAQEYTYLVPQSYRTNNLMRVKFTLTYNGSTPDVKLIIDDVKIYGMVAI